MSLNNKYRALSFLITLAFVLPMVIKTHHMMFPNHEHHCHSCSHQESDLTDICEIQDFDYFFFTSAENIHIPSVVSINLLSHKVEQTEKLKSKLRYYFCLRAPPESVKLSEI